MALFLDEVLPDGDTKNKTFDLLKDTSMWANWTIAEPTPVETLAPWTENPKVKSATAPVHIDTVGMTNEDHR